MAVTLPSVYQDGTATVQANGAVVTGQSTLWVNSVLPGDFFGVHKGYAIRILSVDSNTQLTLANPWPGAAQTAAHYEIMLCPDTSRMQETSRQLLQALSNGTLAALATVGGGAAADQLAYFTGPGTLSLTGLTATGRDIIDSADVSAAQTALGVSTFIKTLLDDANASAALSTLGVSAFAKTLLDDTDASTALSTLGVSAFAKTLLDDTSAGAAWATLGGSISGGGTGWARMPGGLLVQWGDRTAIVSGGGGGFSVPFPTSFSSASSYSFVGINGEAGSGEVVLNAYNGAGAITASNFYLVLMRNGAIFPDSTAARIRWLAIGS